MKNIYVTRAGKKKISDYVSMELRPVNVSHVRVNRRGEVTARVGDQASTPTRVGHTDGTYLYIPVQGGEKIRACIISPRPTMKAGVLTYTSTKMV
jgi:hypothetical protein